MSLHLNVGGTYRQAKDIQVNVGGTWRKNKGVWTNVGGTWRKAFSSEVIYFMQGVSGATWTAYEQGEWGYQNKAISPIPEFYQITDHYSNEPEWDRTHMYSSFIDVTNISTIYFEVETTSQGGRAILELGVEGGSKLASIVYDGNYARRIVSLNVSGITGTPRIQIVVQCSSNGSRAWAKIFKVWGEE